jgi:hypothetical protein
VKRRVLKHKRTTGWFFADGKGRRKRLSDYDPLLIEHLTTAKDRDSAAFGTTIEIEDFSLWRSGRRGATTEATNNGVPQLVIETMGRWRKKEMAKGAQPGMPMRQVYLEVKNAIPTMLRFAADF